MSKKTKELSIWHFKMYTAYCMHIVRRLSAKRLHEICFPKANHSQPIACYIVILSIFHFLLLFDNRILFLFAFPNVQFSAVVINFVFDFSFLFLLNFPFAVLFLLFVNFLTFFHSLCPDSSTFFHCGFSPATPILLSKHEIWWTKKHIKND